MDEKDFNDLDFYGKLSSMSYVSWDVKRQLESIVNEREAQDYIDRLMGYIRRTFYCICRR